MSTESNWAMEPIQLKDGNVEVRTYGHTECAEIAAAIHDPVGWFGRNIQLDTVEQTLGFLERLVDDQGKYRGNSLLYSVDGEIAGVTRLFRMDPGNRTLEIGCTWVAPKWRRTRINTMVKRILLRHAFETLGTERVEFRVNARNFASQMAVLRIGATYEGRLRGAQLYDGQTPNDVFMYSILRAEWSAIRERLNALAAGKSPHSELPLASETPRLRLSLLNPTKDAEDFLDYIRRNRSSLVDSFPQCGIIDTLDESRAYIASKAHVAACAQEFVFGARDASSGALIGKLQVKSLDWKLKSAELGYSVEKERRREGIASEIIETMLRSLDRLGFRRIFIRALPDNHASISLAMKVGFQPEGRSKAAFLSGKGEVQDLVVLSRVRAPAD